MTELQVLKNEIWSPSYIMRSVFQNVIIGSEGKKNPSGSLTILEYVQTRKVECKIVYMM